MRKLWEDISLPGGVCPGGDGAVGRKYGSPFKIREV